MGQRTRPCWRCCLGCKKAAPHAAAGIGLRQWQRIYQSEPLDYCRRNSITFTRSRSYKKNDSCHVEQKNWSVIRRVIGYDRFSSKAAFKALDYVYTLLRLYVNFFQPVLKLVGKSRHGAKVHKVYDKAQTPYQRLLKSGELTEDKRRELAYIYGALNPVTLLKQIRQSVEHLWTLAERSPGKPRSVTGIMTQ